MGEFIVFYIFLSHFRIVLKMAKNGYLVSFYIFTRFQIAVMDFELSTGENVVFHIERYS